MKNEFRIAALSLMLALTGCATQGSLDNIRNDIDSVKTRLFTVEKDMGGIREETKEKLTTFERDMKTEVSSVRKISADIQASIDSNKNDMQAMNGKLEDILAGSKKPAEDLSRYRDDADKRILQLEERILKLQATVDELSKKAGVAVTPQAPVSNAETIYTKALERFKAGDTPTARELFGKFIEQYPKHDLVANANYWIGETYYNEKNYEAAIVAYQEVIKNHPNQPKAPAAKLKQALSFKAIKDTKSARFVLKKLIESHPKSDEAKKARQLLKSIK